MVSTLLDSTTTAVFSGFVDLQEINNEKNNTIAKSFFIFYFLVYNDETLKLLYKIATIWWLFFNIN